MISTSSNSFDPLVRAGIAEGTGLMSERARLFYAVVSQTKTGLMT